MWNIKQIFLCTGSCTTDPALKFDLISMFKNSSFNLNFFLVSLEFKEIPQVATTTLLFRKKLFGELAHKSNRKWLILLEKNYSVKTRPKHLSQGPAFFIISSIQSDVPSISCNALIDSFLFNSLPLFAKVAYSKIFMRIKTKFLFP